MPGTLLLDDWRNAVGDELANHARQAQQAFQVVGNTPPVQTPDPQQVLQELQSHAQQAAQSAQTGLVQFAQQRQQQVQDVGQQLQDYAQQVAQPAQQAVAGVTQFAQPQQAQPQQDVTTFLGPRPAQPISAGQADVQGAPSPDTTVDRGGDLRAYARQAAQRAGIDPDIFVAQIQQESGFTPTARSSAGAIGIAQFMPGTAAGMNVDPTDPYAALDAAARLDAQNLKKYGGDYQKTLAAYNAGGGAVDQYGGVPPYKETQTYVETILNNAKQVVGGAVQRAGAAIPGPIGEGVQQAGKDISQFGDPQLTNSEAYAACGPAAAVRFAERFGRNPTLREAVDLAKQVGWTEASGMAGIGSQQSLLERLGVPTSIVQGAQWDRFAKEAQSGNPITISTPGHYFYADGYDPSSGAFHVGRSGTDLRGGKEWMTAADMEGRMGAVQGALFADNPTVPAKSSTPTYDVGGTRPAPRAPIYAGVMQPAGGDDRAPFQVIGDTVGPVAKDLKDAAGGALGSAGEAIGGALGSAGEAIGGAISGVGAGAQQTATDLGTSRAADIALRQGRTQQEQSEFSQRQLEDAQRIVDEQRRRETEPIDVGRAAGNAWNSIINATPTQGITLDDYLKAQNDKNQWLEQNNPLRDVPLAGGLLTGIAQQLTDPLQVLTFGPTVGLGRAVGAAAGEQAAGAAGRMLSPAATRFVASVADKFTSGAIVGGLQNALFEVEKPGATPESVGQALLVGAGLGGTLDAAAPAVARIGRSIMDRAPELGPILRSRQRAEGINPFDAPPLPGRTEAAPAATDVTSQMQRNFLRDTVRAPNSDPRPQVQESPLPGVKYVHQNDLADLLPPGTTVLYHETSVPNARAILDRIESGPRNQTPIFTSDNLDLALGQGGKGVVLEFDPARSNGGVASQKPGLAFTAATGGGQEYTVSRTLPGAVSSIVVRTERQAAQLATNARVARAFDFANAEPTADGRIRIPRRETTVPTAAPAALSRPAPAAETPTFRAPETVVSTEPVGRVEPPPATAAPEAFAAARAAPGEAATVTTPTARVTVREGGPPLPPREPPAAPSGPPPSGGAGGTSPELDKLNAMYDGKKTASRSSIGERKDAVWRSLTRAFTDRQVDINQAQQRYAANLGRPLRGDEMAAELQRLASDPAAQVKVDEGLKPAIQSVGKDYSALRNYVTLRSNIEIADNLASRTGDPTVGADRSFSGGLTRDESVKAMQDLERQLGPDRFATVQAAADQVTAFNKSLRERLVEAGVLDEGTAAQLEAQYPNWAKTRILDYMADPTGGQGAGTKIGLSDRGLREYSLKGTERAREDPVASTVAYAHQVERMAMKNEAFNAFLKIDQAGETPMLRKVPQSYTPKSNEVTMIGFVDGEKQKYVTDNKALGAAINGAGVMSTPEWTSAWQKVFRSLATSRNPLFLAGNAALDIPTYVLRQSVREGGPQALPRILYELARGYGDAFQGLLQSEFRGTGTSEFLKGGGGQSGYFTGGEGQSKRAVAEMQRNHVFQIGGIDDLGRLTKDLLTLHPVEALGERIELGPRVAAMRLAQRRGENATKAVIDGRTVTVDFSQGGTVTKYLNNFIPFFNVGFQGPAQVARAFRDNPRAFVATVGTLLGVPSAAAEVWNKSDPQRAKDYADVPQYVKDQGVVVMLPGEAPVDKQGNRKPMYAVIKLREWAPFAAAAREATDRVMGDDSRSWQEMASSTLSGFSPVQAQNVAQVGTEPLAGIPILPAAAQLSMNTDFFRGRTIVTQRADENASAFAKALTPAIQQVVDRAGINAEIRPSAIDFLVRNQGAGVGGAALSASNLATGQPSDTAGVTGTPGIGGLAGRFVGNQTGDELQQARDRTLSAEGRQILRSNGITITPGAVSSSINQIPINIDEETRYQQLANQYIDEAIQRTAASADFATKTQVGKQSLMDQAMQAARQRAGIQVLNTIAADEKSRRLRTKSTAPAA